ncbi:Pre-mRNA-splicing factor RSE1 [Sparassis crispa]|uniref:DNA damage-binding protein 1 n=1 Tax=Sparassis crispa TaxID=139825 RepID=A0A401GYZ3_9APHY|nr:Pre-mRNA-splicing factor RSE1 [Sparassis crispa]GBE87385.1 Pre-mRNA-splicing factor RSE1 [Sparassis crispa]
MHLYNLTLQPPTAINQAVVGNFSGGRQQEIVVSYGTRVGFICPDPDTGKLVTVSESDVFASIRSLASFRLTGGTKDYVVVGSDSGRIVILDYDPKTGTFVKLHQETFGKSGARRVVPGQYLATDPKGRCVMISALEKSKLVYVLNRDTTSNLTISSPLEAHKNMAIVHHIVGLDVGFENPAFAVLEVDYAKSDQDPTGEAFQNVEKMLTYYELDLGLNHIVRKWSERTDSRANLLAQVPGGQLTTSERFDGPSGVLVCCEDHIIYQHMNAPQHRVPIPRREHPLEDSCHGLLIVSVVMHKLKGSFFFLLQSEKGDLYKVTIEHEHENVKALKIKYFSTVPVSSSLCILKSGFLFVASEFGNHLLYQFQKLGDEDGEPEFSSTSYPSFGMQAPAEPLPRAYFKACDVDNLVLVDEVDSLNPILDAKVMNVLPHSTPQIITACGRGARSSLRTLRHGLDVEEIVDSVLPYVPNGVWTAKKKRDDTYDSYIILSFTNGTLVLAIGENIEEIQDTGFLSSVPTLAVQQISEDTLLQVHSRGIRHILASRHVSEWSVPEGKAIVAATTNRRQIVVALSSAELVYFELNSDGQLNEYQERKAMGSTVLAMSVGEVPESRQRMPYVAVGCEDQTVRIISLGPETTLETISLQALTAPPSSISMINLLDKSINKSLPTTFVYIGLQNGVLLRTVLDVADGRLTDTRTRFLGTRSVRLVRVEVQRTPAILALSSRMWLNYTYRDSMHFTPLLSEPFEFASTFSFSSCPEGFIGIAGNTLRILQVPKHGSELKQNSAPLSYTPRKIVSHPENHYLYLIESDHRTWSESAARSQLTKQQEGLLLSGEIGKGLGNLLNVKAPAGIWASCIRIVDPVQNNTVAVIPLDNNEAAFSLAVVPFTVLGGELRLVVGTGQDTVLAPRSCTRGFFHTYCFTMDGAGLELLHKTETRDIPHAIMPFNGMLVAGVGSALGIYDTGKKQLLRKAENRNFTSAIVTLSTQGHRILVGDMQESVSFAVYKPPENRLLVFADDTQARWVTAQAMLDYTTVAIGDKFGNILINRLDMMLSDKVDADSTGAGILQRKANLMGAPLKTQMLCHFHVGDIVTSIQNVALVVGGHQVVLYTGLHGTIGILVALVSKEDVDFVSTLEQHMRSEQLSLVGRDHLAWRGYYVPVKAVVDGDLCEMFVRLPAAKQRAVAAELDRTVGEVLKKLEQLRVMAGGF